MIIRKAKMEDAKELNHLLTLLIQDEKKYDPNINDTFVVTNMYENYVEDGNKCLLVAEKQEEILGYLYGYKKKKDETTILPEVKLDALYVKEKYRHQGVADALLVSFKNWAKEQNVKSVDVRVWNENTNAKRLYTKHQFVPKMEILKYEIKG